MEKQWYGVDLEKYKAEQFRECLTAQDIQFESSENYNLVHFEVLLSPGQISSINLYLSNLK